MADQPAAPSAPAPVAPAPAAAATPPPAAASPPAAPAAPARPLSEAQKRQVAHDNMAKARAAKAAKASGAPAAPAVAPAAATPAAEPATPAEPKQETAAQLALRLRKAEKELNALKQSGEATKGELELLAALRDPAKRWGALDKLGVRYDEWTGELLKAAGVQTEAPPDETPREKELRERLAALEGKHTEAEQAAQRAIAERDHTRRVEFARGIVAEGGEKYALTAALGRHSDLLLEHERIRAEEAIDNPDPHVVAANVEKLHEGALRKQLTALAKTAKGKALLAEIVGVQAQAAPAPTTEHEPAPVPNNGMSAARSSNGGPPPEFYTKWTDRQRREWAQARAGKRASA